MELAFGYQQARTHPAFESATRTNRIGPQEPWDGYNKTVVEGESGAAIGQASKPLAPRRRLSWRTAALLAILAAVLPGLGSTLYRVWPQKLMASYRSGLPIPRAQLGHLRLGSPSGRLWAQVGSFRNELSAYLEFEYLRSLKAVDNNRVVLTSYETSHGPAYRIYVSLPDDLLAGVPYLAQLRAQGFIGGFSLGYPGQFEVEYARAQTALFVAAYNQPIRHKLESLPPSQLTANVARFVLFKAKTDRRVRERIEAVPTGLSGEQAHELAADIIAVASFYSLPLDFFLGIGAMENNFLDVQGDLEHTAWKRRAQPGDIVLKRRRRRVLVRNYSIGVWQITRETLRYAHDLYLKDKRDYSHLPERLRPPSTLDLSKIDSHVLTAYAGLLFRDLLDRSGGDVKTAVAAYNGGIRNPNLQYASGVEMVATYARRVLEQAAFVNGSAIAHTTLVMARR